MPEPRPRSPPETLSLQRRFSCLGLCIYVTSLAATSLAVISLTWACTCSCDVCGCNWSAWVAVNTSAGISICSATTTSTIRHIHVTTLRNVVLENSGGCRRTARHTMQPHTALVLRRAAVTAVSLHSPVFVYWCTYDL